MREWRSEGVVVCRRDLVVERRSDGEKAGVSGGVKESVFLIHI